MAAQPVASATPIKHLDWPTVPTLRPAARADLIRRDFTADAAKINSRWCGDIIYVGT
jgi:putative transposase